MNKLLLIRPIMVKFFSKSALKHPFVIRKASYVQDQRGCMAIIRGHLVPLSLIRGYADDKTTPSKEQGPEGKIPGFVTGDDDTDPFPKKIKNEEEELKEKEEKSKSKDDKFD